MSVTEIETSALQLSADERRALIVRLLQSLGTSPEQTPLPRNFSREQIDEWIREDEESMRRLQREGLS